MNPVAPNVSSASGDSTGSAASAGPPASWIVAALLSLVAPGLGHVYERQTRRGLVWFAATIAIALTAPASMRLPVAVFFVLLMAVTTSGLAFRLAAALDAALLVRRPPGSRASWRRVGFAGITMVAILLLYSMGSRHFLLEAFTNPSAAMIPTILIDDRVFIDKLRSLARGDVIVFPLPEHPEQSFVKRVVGMPGDTLSFRRGGHPVINGIEVPSCLVGEASYQEPGEARVHAGKVFLEVLGNRRYLTFYDDGVIDDEQGPYTVKPGEVFVVGDNRENSHDSRFWYGGEGGGVPLSTVSGVAFVTWLAQKGQRIDWARMGTDLGQLAVPPWLAHLRPGVDACTAKIMGTST